MAATVPHRPSRSADDSRSADEYCSADGGGDGRYLAALLVGYPLAWALGLGPFIFIPFALIMLRWLVARRPFRVPSGTLVYGVFLIMVAGSIVQVNSPGRLALWLLRASWYAAAGICLVYLARQSGPALRRTMVRAMVGLFALVVVGGYGAVVAPTLAWRSPMSYLLPGVIANDEFVADLINPRVAEIQSFPWVDVILYRPAAPFSYTNAWGSTFALLFPFLIAAYQDRRIGIPRRLIVAIGLAGMVPFYQALNRGSWLTLGLGLIFGVIRWSVITRDLKAVRVLAGLAALALPVVMMSGVLGSATSKLDTRAGDSDATRATIYVETFTESLRSPLVGYGAPRTNPANPNGPPLGTHGQLWAVMFANGFVALTAYLLFFGLGFLKAWGQGPVGHWSKVSLGIGILQIPIYGHLPLQLFIMVAAVVMAAWPDVLASEAAETVDADAVDATPGPLIEAR